VFLDFLESYRCPLNNLFGFISIGVSMLNNTSLQKVDFLLTLKRTCNVLIYMFQMKHFLTMLVRHEVVENLISFFSATSNTVPQPSGFPASIRALTSGQQAMLPL